MTESGEPTRWQRLASAAEVGRRTGLLDPRTLGASVAAAGTWGASVAAPYASAALRHPHRTALVDAHGAITYRELDLRTTRLASGLQSMGVGRTSTVGVLCRNHRGFVEANIAAAKLGLHVVYLNTGLPEAQLEQVIEREQISFVLADEEFDARLAAIGSSGIDRFLARLGLDPSWTFTDVPKPTVPLLLPRPWRSPEPVVLTSGTSGAPKGTQRTNGVKSAATAAGVITVIPYERGDTFVIPAPLFHAWGLSQMVTCATLGGTAVLPGGFDPATVMALVDVHQATVLAAVPVMLHRILEAQTGASGASLRITATSGSALPGNLAERWMDAFGDHLYSLYGSTEVGQVAVATPSDLRAAPGTAGRPLPGIDVRILDDTDRELPSGAVGRIFVASSMHFDGYTGGGGKARVGEHMEIGDQGSFDDDGRLRVVGRADDMIITGGENVYPSNIERSLLEHPKVSDAAVVGVADDDFGQRIRAVIVTTDQRNSDRRTASIKKHLQTQLASYEVPREFVYVDTIPRNPAGKVLRHELR
ncbi:MAG: AMP-binding protein [Acidimicrobiales bacterium]